MFLNNIQKIGKTAKVMSKITGEVFRVRLVAKSAISTKNDLFMIQGKCPIWRDSLRRRYNEI